MPVLSNPRHERFAQELAKGKTATEAYVLAGYKPNDGNAATLKGNQRVIARLAELQERTAARIDVTVQSLLEEAEAARVLAMAIEAPSAAIAAVKEKGVLSGKRVERTAAELTGADRGPIETKDVTARDLVLSRIGSLAARRPAEGGSRPH
jgi:phage terminase small subunit